MGKLHRVHWHDGRDELVLVHVEVQAQNETDFAQRMCVDNCRIWEGYQRPIVSLALLVDGDPWFRPTGRRQVAVLVYSDKCVVTLRFGRIWRRVCAKQRRYRLTAWRH